MARPATESKVKSHASTPIPSGFYLIVVGRFVTNIAFRLVFPFLPRIARGLGVSLSTMGTALAIREAAGAASPVLGRAADRRGHVNAMVVAFGLMATALVLQGASSGLVLFTLALSLLTVAKNLFDAGSAAWVGHAVPFAQRGRAMGTLETSWAAAFIVGMPIAALIIRGSTWRTPFIVTAFLCAFMALALHARLPRVTPAGIDAPQVRWSTPLRAGVATIGIIGVGHSMMLVTFASWLEDEHRVSVSGLGLTALVIGLAELGGSGGSALLGDRLGLRRTLRVSLVLSVPASALVALGGASLPAALVLMAIYFVVVEFAIVALLSLFSELDPNARGMVMGWAFFGFTIGHAIGAVIGTQLYERSGMTVNVIAMAATFAAAFAIVQLWLTDPGDAR